MDIKHLPKLETAEGERRKRFLYVAIDRASRWVHLAVRDNEGTASAIAFRQAAIAAAPVQVTHVLTDRGSCFTAKAFEEACRPRKVQHRKTKPYTPQTNGLVERFNGRGPREVLGIIVLQPSRPRNAAPGLQPGLQQETTTGAGRRLSRAEGPGAPDP